MQKNWNNKFLKLIKKKKYQLPIKRNKERYDIRLKSLLLEYEKDIKDIKLLSTNEQEDLIKICFNINEAVDYYYLGLPSDAYLNMEKAMLILESYYWGRLKKSPLGGNDLQIEPLKLYRMRNLDEEKCSRKDLFHLPYSLREKASTSRYSIAGFPSLYLSTSIQLCSAEIGSIKGWVCEYEIQRNHSTFVYDLAIKPSDFTNKSKIEEIKCWTNTNIKNEEIKKKYLMWYPLIAACSFMSNKQMNVYFVPEYIIPQLFLQWARKKAYKIDSNCIYGVRYFSCNGEEKLDNDYNYVFPVSKNSCSNADYCNVLSKTFKLSTPSYIKNPRDKYKGNKDFELIC